MGEDPSGQKDPFVVYIEASRDLIDAYPDRFDTTTVDLSEYAARVDITYELPIQGESLPSKRLFGFHDSVAVLEGEGTQIWELNPTSSKNFNSIHSKVVSQKLRTHNPSSRTTEEIVLPETNQIIKITYLAPSPENSIYIRDILERKA